MGRATVEEQTGTIGASEVAGNFERINWGPVPNSYHDLGTDLLVQARDARLFDRGLLVGVQVKGGPSFFKEAEMDPETGEVIGWWYREGGVHHFEDWVCHDLPHLLVLHDLDTRVSYWKHVTSDQVVTTGKGAKILVPRSQTIDKGHIDDLLEVAASRRARISHEGSLWAQGADAISPARRLRYALIASRIIAPHRNAGHEQAITSLEAISLLAEGRIRDLDIFTDKHGSVPSPSECLTSRDWLWKFYGALHLALVDQDTSHVQERVSDAHSHEHRSAACIASVCLLMDAEEHEKANELLREEIDRDDASPIDFAWLLAQRGRLRAEMGDVDGARGDAARAQRELIGESGDITATAVKAAATSLLFDTAPWGNKNLKESAAANDTTISWWRSRSTATGLSEFFDDSFREWAGGGSRLTKFEDIANNRLFSARLNADLVGEHGVWRSLSSLSARHTLMDGIGANDDSRSAVAINDLRRCGDAGAFEKALARIRRTGPLAVLRDVPAQIEAHGWTHTTARSNLAFWEVCGDLLDADQSDWAVQYCLDILEDGDAFSKRINPTFRINHYVPRAISSLLSSCSDEIHRHVVSFLANSLPVTDVMTASAYGRVIAGLRLTAMDDQMAQQNLKHAHEVQQHPKINFPVARVLASANEEYKGRLLSAISSGNIDALIALQDLSELDSAAAAASSKLLKGKLEKIIQDAQQGSHSLYELDAGGCLALISALHPEIAEWELIERFMIDEKIPADAKRQTFISVAHYASALPQDVKEKMRDIAASVSPGNPVDPLFGPPVGAVPVFLLAVTGGISGDALDSVLAQLLVGSVQERCDAAAIMSILRKPDYALTLAVLLKDADAYVRISAAGALATWAAESDDQPNPVISQGFERALKLASTGFQVALAIANAVAHSSASSDTTARLLQPLQEHPSAIVRERVSAALAKGS
ncbi:DUF4365 domain-containing protein [Streptomyces sp. NPDC020802]|uniref:DUF4365 domain-containing protein n=1 Tax=Streptomyces sp. NPDC020802 TaxID=3365094 RepID=UPI0037A4C76A